MKLNKLINGMKSLLVLALLATPLLASPKVVGYYPYWGQYAQYTPDMVKYNYYTDIVYGYFVPAEDGSIALADEGDAANFASMLTKAKENNVSVSVSIGGPGEAEAMQTIAADESLRGIFATNVAKLINDKGLAGIEISWEYPSAEEKDNFSALISAVDEAIGDKSLSVSVLYKGVADYDIEALKKADFINVIALDMSTADADQVQPNCNSVEAIASLKTWTGAGLDASKILLTIPFYGRSYMAAKKLGDAHEGFGSGNEGMVNWVDMMTKFDGSEYTVSFDEASKSEIAVSEIEIISFNGIPSVKYMSEEIKNGGYAGIQFADIAGDHKEAIVSLTVTAVKILRPEVELKTKKK